MARRLLISIAILGGVAIIGIAIALPKYMVEVHQRSTTLELARWKSLYGRIGSKDDAIRTAEMLKYVQSYYVPGDGYRSTPEIEKVLQTQRQDTVDSFVTALRTFTKTDYGTDADKWLKHLKRMDD